MTPTKDLLHKTARLYNVQTAYYDVSGRYRESPPEAILEVLKILGAPVTRLEDMEGALRQRRHFLWQRGIEPVVVAWQGAPPSLKVRVGSASAEATVHYELVLESGEHRRGVCHDEQRRNPVAFRLDGASYITRFLTVPESLPFGYHRLRLEIGEQTLRASLLAAPLRAFASENRTWWGVFCPLYALRSEGSWGTGSFSDLQSFSNTVDRLGGNVVATLPLLAAFLDQLYDPSPYAPVSRLFWNELFLDVGRIPELKQRGAAKSIANSSSFEEELNALRAEPLVQYRRAMALKRRVLQELARSVLTGPSERRESFERFIDTHPKAEDYAAFRATVERENKPWHEWPPPARNGTLSPAHYSPEAKQYHLYVQWQCSEQMQELAATKGSRAALYLDFPLGVNRDGYDVWRERSAFALDASGGAPPDDFFSKGQDWGFPPLNPEGLRNQGYAYYIDCVRHHLAPASLLRIDHVMGLHRLYWVPRGFAPNEGVYVRYPAEEFYAILSLESERHRAEIAGENLGTVPPYVNAAMERHKVHGMFVGQFCVGTDRNRALPSVPVATVASLNTHDTPTFAGFWHEHDIDDRIDLGLLSGTEIDRERRTRAAQREALAAYLQSRGWLVEPTQDPAAVLRAWLFEMAQSEAHLLLVTLEDLWLETAPQNVPGTWQERPNWQRKLKFSLDSAAAMTSVIETLKKIDLLRKERH